MKKIFLDTNILVDLIADRKPFSKYTIQLFQKAELNEIQLFTSSHSIAKDFKTSEIPAFNPDEIILRL